MLAAAICLLWAGQIPPPNPNGANPVPPPPAVANGAHETNALPAQEKDVYVLGTRRCSFPFDIGEGSREKIGWINVYCSTDQGKSWKKMGQAKADAGSLPVEFETNGLYWIAMQIFSVNGTTDPLSTEDLKPVMKVRVDENPNRK